MQAIMSIDNYFSQ